MSLAEDFLMLLLLGCHSVKREVVVDVVVVVTSSATRRTTTNISRRTMSLAVQSGPGRRNLRVGCRAAPRPTPVREEADASVIAALGSN